MPGFELIGKEEASAVAEIFDEGGILFAHGFDSLRKKYHVREFEAKSSQYFKVNYSNRRNQDSNTAVRKDDIIFVESTSLAKISDTLNTITGPIRNTISIYALFKLIEN